MSFACIIAIIAINIDSLVIGVAYGIAEIKMSLTAKLGISLSTGITLFVTVFLGNYFAGILNSSLLHWLSAVLLLIFGGVLILCSAFSEEQVLNRPEKADSNSDKILSFKEAVLLGIALSADSLGAGFSLGLMGAGEIFAPILVFAVNVLFLIIGEESGKKVSAVESTAMQKTQNLAKKLSAYIPGAVLVLLALWKAVECIIP